MPKVKITNLKPGACVINSLKITIAGGSSVTRDASVIGDADLTELESYGIISVSPVDEVPQAPKPAPQAKPVVVPPAKTAKKAPPKGIAKQGKAPASPKPQTPPLRPGTDFRAVDGPEDQMGRKVVVMGENGPKVSKMGPGINGQPGPKYAGDTEFEGSTAPDESQEEGFVTV